MFYISVSSCFVMFRLWSLWSHEFFVCILETRVQLDNRDGITLFCQSLTHSACKHEASMTDSMRQGRESCSWTWIRPHSQENGHLCKNCGEIDLVRRGDCDFPSSVKGGGFWVPSWMSSGAPLPGKTGSAPRQGTAGAKAL